ncbi:MAG: autotransporter domain-containing protein, partial [Moraxella sp.]|nr:autotransporter domain-containing protein [Moraxella sp.]
RQEAERLEAARLEAERLEAERQAELARQEAEEAARLEAERQAELARQEAERIEAERQAELARQEAARLEAERQAELARQEAARLEAERQAELAKQEAEHQAELARQEAERLEAARLEAERLETERQAELAKQQAEEAARQEAERQAELARQEAARLEAERQAELARLEREHLEAERLETERQAELAKQEAEHQAELARQEAERLEAARLEAERLEAERQAELARQEAEEAARLEAERQAELARQEAERIEAERQAELARQEAARLEAERQAELARQEAARLEAERQAELAKQEASRLEAERQAELARQEAERLAREQAQKNQADYISRYTNAGLSEIAGAAHTLSQINRGLNSHILADDTPNVWVNTQISDNTHQSTLYRPFDKADTLVQVGIQEGFDNTHGRLHLGAVHSRHDSKQSYADHITNEQDTHTLSVFAKQKFQNGVFLAGDMSAGVINSTLSSQGEDIALKRKVASAGIHAGKAFTTSVVDIEPSVSVRYDRLSDENYTLNQAVIESDDIGIVSYRAGLKLSKEFHTAGGSAIRPFVASEWTDSSSETTLMVNQHHFTQAFERTTSHALGLEVDKDTWKIRISGSHIDSSESEEQTEAAVSIGFRW